VGARPGRPGEPGIGKTRLADEIQVVAQLNGAVVLRGGCYEYEAATPYLPFAEALCEWVGAQKTAVLEQFVRPVAPELARLAPEIESRLGPLEPEPPLPPAEERLRLFDHVTRFLRALAVERGVLLFIDDLHWADQGTLHLLHYLLRHLRNERLLALAAYRELELDRAHPLAAALVEWNRERLATRLPLGRLSMHETGAQLAMLFGQDSVSPDFAAAIHRETEGNPFFVEEVIKSLIEQGQVYRENGGWGRREIADLTIPQSIKEAVGRRLNRLSSECVEALHTAAALGKVFAFRELAAVAAAGRGDEQLLNALDEAEAAQLIQVGSGESFAFTHDKIREVLYEELNPIRRRRLHQRIADALAQLYASSLDSHIEDLAYHFAEAGDLSNSLHYSLQAAENAARLLSLDEALGYYEQAREAAEALNLPESLAAVYAGRGDVFAARGQANAAIESLLQALALSDDRSRCAVLKARIGAVYVVSGGEEGQEYLQAALRELDPHTQADAVAIATTTLGRYYHLHGQHQRAVETFEQALSVAEGPDNPYTISGILSFLAGAYQHLARYDQSVKWARRCIAYGERRNYPLAIATGYEFIAEAMLILGRWREGLEDAEQDRQIGERFGAPARVGWAAFSRAHNYLGLGELAAGASAGQEALDLAESIGDRRLAIMGGASLALCLASLGDLDAARQIAETAHAAAETSSQFFLFVESGLALAYVHRMAGAWAEAAALLDQCAATLAPTDNLVMRFRMGGLRAESYVGLGRFADAERIAADAAALAGEASSRHYQALAGRVEAQALAALGRVAEAETRFDEVVATLEALESRLEWGRALRERGRLRHSQHDASAAQADWERALALFKACGAAPDEAQTAQLLNALPGE
jgi:tetratricopeptide (TPR) repeat protein